jgi:hypothetical protein
MANILTVELVEDNFSTGVSSPVIQVTIAETVAIIGGGGGGGANLTYTASATNGKVNSDSGTDATLPAVDGTNAGLMLPGHKTKLDYISVTQAVNLDTLETDSHTHSNKATLDLITAAFTTTLESKLNGIEAGADVTDATNVNAAGAVMNTDYSQAHSILVQQSGTGTPTVLPVPSNSIVGNNGGGDIVALTATQVRTLINVEDGADVTDAANVGAVNHAATAKTTPVDADTFPITDTQASNVIKKLSFTNLKAFLKTYFDGLYQAAGTYLTSANITATITNGVTDKAPSEDAVFDALALKASSTFIETIAGLIETPSDTTYKLVVKMPYAGTINETTTVSTSGTCTATFKVNTTALGGTANSVSSSEQSQTHSSSNTFVAGDDIQLTVSANSTCANMSFSIKITRTI